MRVAGLRINFRPNTTSRVLVGCIGHNRSNAVLPTVANSLLSLVVVATFMWGGCVSCNEYFMFPGKQQNSCCNKSGKCERPGKTPSKPETKDCNRLPFERGGTAHDLPLPAVLPTVTALAPQLPPAAALTRTTAFEALLDPSPPDVQALNSTFLI